VNRPEFADALPYPRKLLVIVMPGFFKPGDRSQRTEQFSKIYAGIVLSRIPQAIVFAVLDVLQHLVAQKFY